jgi:phospholipase D-like protein
MSSRSLIVLPDDAATPILEAIGGAKKTLRIKMFVFSDPALIDAVIAAHRRGVKVQVMLNPERRSGEEDNEATRRKLSKAGVAVKDSNPAVDLTHEKSMVADDAVAFVKSLNWATKNLTETRDYAVVTDHKHEVGEIVEGFEADWERQKFDPGAEAHLIWCPINGRDRIARFIDAAKHTLFVQNERYQDAVILERLVRAAERGVKVHVMARPPHSLKKEKLVEGVGGLRILDDVGIKIHKLKGLKLHGKMLLADGVAAIVGSINLAPGSASTRSRRSTGTTPTRSTSRTRDSSRISRTVRRARREGSPSTPTRRRSRRRRRRRIRRPRGRPRRRRPPRRAGRPLRRRRRAPPGRRRSRSPRSREGRRRSRGAAYELIERPPDRIPLTASTRRSRIFRSLPTSASVAAKRTLSPWNSKRSTASRSSGTRPRSPAR